MWEKTQKMNKKPVTHVNQNTTHFFGFKATLEFEQNLIQVLTLDLYVPTAILCYKAIIIFMQLVFNSQLKHRYANYNHTPS